MKYLLFILFIILPLSAHADVYMETDKNGNITYSDTPLSDNAKKIETSEINTTSSVPANTPSANQENEAATSIPYTMLKATRKPYTTFLISSPEDQATIQNQPSITVYLKIDPHLQEDDSIQVFLDGKPWGKPLPTTQFAFTTPDRGIHQISAKVLDKNGLVLKEAPSNTVYIHHAALGASPPILGPGM